MLDHHLSKLADEKGRIAGYWNVFFLGRLTFLSRFFASYCLGISLQFASLLISWPSGLYAGFWPYFLSTLIIGVAYCCIMLCLAEMTSILPFSGTLMFFLYVLYLLIFFYRGSLWICQSHHLPLSWFLDWCGGVVCEHNVCGHSNRSDWRGNLVYF